jgi:hypothetical protein
MAVSFQEAADAAIFLNYGGASQALVRGLNKLTPPGLTRDIIEAQEFRNAFSRKFTGGGRQGTLKYSGNAVFNDLTGQVQLKRYLKANTKFGPVGSANGESRIYLNKITSELDSDFIAPDTAFDSTSAMQVAMHDYGEGDINGLYPYEGEIVFNGATAVFMFHLTADTIAFVASSGTITDSASGFVTAGFAAGQSLIVEGTSNNDGIFTIASVVAGTITLSASDTLVDESAGTDFTLHGGE